MKPAVFHCPRPRRRLLLLPAAVCLLLLRGVFPTGSCQAQSVVLDTFHGLTGASTGFSPLVNVSAAAGREGLLQVVNSTAAYYPRTGDSSRAPLWRVGLDRAAGGALPGSTRTFDPKVVHDRLSDRFFIIILDAVTDQPQKSWLHLLVSRTGHPAGKMNTASPPVRVFNPEDWFIYRHDLTRPRNLTQVLGGDYPAIGVDGKYFYVALNYLPLEETGSGQRPRGELDEAGILAFDKAALMSGAGAVVDGTAPPPVAPRAFFPSPTDGSIQPAMSVLPPADPLDAWFMGLDQDAVDTFLDTFYLDYRGGGFLTDDDQTSQNDQAIPDPAPQPSPAPFLDTIADRLLGAVRDGSGMWGVYVSEDDNSDRSVVRWVKMRPQPGGTVIEAQGKLDAGGGLWNYLPAIGINAAGSVCISWTATSADTNPAIYYAVTGRNTGSGPQTPGAPQRLLLSSTPYSGTPNSLLRPARWGDYASVVSDPLDESFWICHPFASTSAENDWGSWWAKITPVPLPVFSPGIGVLTAGETIPNTGNPQPHPQSGRLIKTVAVCSGRSVSLSVGVIGHHAYRWLKDGALLEGSENRPSIQINTVDLEHQAVYRVEAENSAGVRAWSDEFYLDVKIPPVAVMNRMELRLRPNTDYGYFEVLPDPALRAEMEPLTYTWDRPGHVLLQDGRVLVFTGDRLRTGQDAAAVDGRYVCTVSNGCGSLTLNADLMVGPRIVNQPQAPAGAVACGPPVTLSVVTDGVLGGGAPESRPDFAAPYNGYQWLNHQDGIIKITWRHRGVPIVPGGRFAVAPAVTGGDLTITDPDYEDEGDYDCLIEDAWGESRQVTSAKTWLQLQPTPPWLTLTAQGPDSRDGHAVIYDQARQETVLFGGEAYGADPRPNQPDYYGRYNASDTWTWNGVMWTRRTPAHQPPSLKEFALAYDQRRERVVLFGGRRTDGSAAATDATWEWDGEDWTLVTTAARPPARSRHSMCYDPVRREVLLIGGDLPGAGNTAAERKKLWAYDGVNWVVRNADFIGGPDSAPYYGPAFAFDERRGVAVLYDRVQAGAVYVLPEWNGSAWVAGVMPPGTTYGGPGRGMFYDPWRRCLTVTGGSAQNGATDKTLMHYDGVSWRAENPPVLDSVTGGVLDLLNVRVTAAQEVAFDRQRRAYVWFHSRSPFYLGQAFTREVRFSCKPWIAHLPPAVHIQTGQMAQFRVIAAGLPEFSWQWFRHGVPLADGDRILGARTANLKVLRCVAGDAGAYTVAVSNDHGQALSAPVPLTVTGPVLTDSAVMTAAPGAVAPPVRLQPLTALTVASPGTGDLVLDGGGGGGPLPPAPVVYLWTHNGRPAGSPSAVATLTISRPDYDTEGVWELFARTGDNDATRRLVRAWRVLVPGDLPYITLQDNGGIPRLTDAVMAWDSRRGVTVVFGGLARGTIPGSAQTGNFNSGQTWEWDGLGWLMRRPAVSPPPLDQAGMVFDAARGRMILFGGRKYAGTATGSAFAVSNETWEYDGAEWIQARPQTSPPPNTRMSMCYDPVRGETLMIGGDIAVTAGRHDLWAWNGLNWTRREAVPPYRSATGPVELYGQNAMAFDESRGVAVLFGSVSGGSSDYDVLEWDGSHWRAVTPEPAPAGETLPRPTSNGTAFYEPWRQLTGLAGAVSHSNEKGLRYWDGTRFTSGNTTIRDELGTHAWTAFEMIPGRRNTVAFDRVRRALVWMDAPAYDFAARQTRELHFTSAPKILRLPPVHSGAPGGAAGLRAIAAGRAPLTWRWSRGGGAALADGGRISGATTSALRLTGLTAADAGFYSVTAGNSVGSAAGITELTLEQALRISGENTGAGLWLSWPDPAHTLQSGDSPSGPWLPVPEASSPIHIPALEPKAFFRVVSP